MSTPFEISDRFTEELADLEPLYATLAGIGGRDHLSTDFSPQGNEARTDLFRRTRSEIGGLLDHPDPDQGLAARVLAGWLDDRLVEAEQRKWSWDLNHSAAPFRYMCDVFDIMSRTDAEGWAAISARLEAFPTMLEGYMKSLQEGIDSGETVARRQVLSVIEQAEAAGSDDSRFDVFPEEAGTVGADRDKVAEAVGTAKAACQGFAEWLTSTYLPHASERDGVGLERYVLAAREFLGMELDPYETYDWGWSELHRLMADMERTAADVEESSTLQDVIELLETDPTRSAGTRAEFAEFVLGIQRQAISQLDGAHFDVPLPLKTVTVNIAPPGGPLGAWYVGPSEDGARPGSIWYAHGDIDRIPYWSEVSTAYHEGFPGHHLQSGTAVLLEDKLSRAQRLLIWYSGSGEGWALYAERLMDELGYFEKPEYRLGLLASQILRAARVVIDIGCHLELRIPEDAPLHPGELWGYDQAVDYMTRIALQPRGMAESEVKRYLGWPAQAISYKVGEREILDIREQAMRRPGFDRKDFHRRMLEAGAIRLDDLRRVVL
jgi:uncharacterized protein (DUF885 family)